MRPPSPPVAPWPIWSACQTSLVGTAPAAGIHRWKPGMVIPPMDRPPSLFAIIALILVLAGLLPIGAVWQSGAFGLWILVFLWGAASILLCGIAYGRARWKKLDAAGAALFGLLLGLTGLIVASLRIFATAS